MFTARDMWKLINLPEPPRDRSKAPPPRKPLRRLMGRYFFNRRHRMGLIIAILIGSAAGAGPFFYAGAIRVLTDEVFEVQLMRQAETRAADLDPTLPHENRLFTFDDPRRRDSWTERLDARQGKSTQEKLVLLTQLALGLVLLELVRAAARFHLVGRTLDVSQDAQFRMRQHLHDKLHKLPLSYHDQHSPGRLLTHLFSDAKKIQNIAIQLMRQIPPAIFTILTGIGIVLWMDPMLGLLVLISLPTYALSYRWFRTRLKNTAMNAREREGKLNAHIANRVSNFRLVKAFRREAVEGIEFMGQAVPWLRFVLAQNLLQIGFTIACALISTSTMVAVIWLAAVRVRDGQMSVGQMLMFHAAAATLFVPVSQLTLRMTSYYVLKVTAIKVMRVLDEPIDLASPETPTPLPTDAPDVQFEHVTMQYEEAAPDAIHQVSFTIPAGQRLAVMGPSGAGKSTMARLAIRLYDPTEGVVRYDGIDVREFDLGKLRYFTGFVAQEPVVFSGTIGDNIRYASQDASPGNVVAAAQYAQIHEFIHQLPERYQTLTQERGLTLSGGQKQRVNLARAILHDPKFLVLDDCTSALDAETEAKLIESFRESLEGRTSMIVTHRVGVAMECDLVMMLDAGGVAQFGPPKDLLNKPGPFAEVHRQQVEPLRLVEA